MHIACYFIVCGEIGRQQMLLYLFTNGTRTYTSLILHLTFDTQSLIFVSALSL